MTSPWLQPPVIVAGIAAIAATASATVSFLLYRHHRRARADVPTVTCSEVEWVDGFRAFFEITIEVKNLSYVGWKISAIEVKRPRDVLLARDWKMHDEDGGGGWTFAGDLTRMARRAFLHHVVPPQSNPDAEGTKALKFYVYSQSSSFRRRVLQLRLELCSLERVQRSVKITIKRDLPTVVG